ncbi:hypothetical protein SO694_0026606 [Aureococcus anophagefferens]|uniref:Bromo domain-containing protein n=1 Tax=Aureococcus anophagefferens TaxID=44056 RepID=A0ABR1G881_AURAN
MMTDSDVEPAPERAPPRAKSTTEEIFGESDSSDAEVPDGPPRCSPAEPCAPLAPPPRPPSPIPRALMQLLDFNATGLNDPFPARARDDAATLAAARAPRAAALAARAALPAAAAAPSARSFAKEAQAVEEEEAARGLPVKKFGNMPLFEGQKDVAGARAATVQFLDDIYGASHGGARCPPDRYAGWSVVLTDSASEPTNFVDAAGVVYRRRNDAARAMGATVGQPSASATCHDSKYARTPYGDRRALLLESGSRTAPKAPVRSVGNCSRCRDSKRGCDKCRPDGAPAIAAPSARRVAAPAPAPSARRVARLAPVPSPSERRVAAPPPSPSARRVAAPAPAPVHRLLASAPSAPSVGPSPGSKFWDEGQDWVVYRREGRRTWMPAPVQAYVELDVVYYYPAGAPEPTEESYLDECEYSAVDEVEEWIAKTPSRPAPPPPTPAFAAGLGPAPGTRFVDEGKLFVVFRREPRVVATDVMRNMASNALGSKEVLKERDVVYYYAAGARVIPDETSYLDVCDYKDVGSIRELIASTKVYTCEPCGRTFASANALNGHQTNLVCRAALDRSKPKPKPAAKAAPVFVRAATFLDDDDEVGDRCPICCTVSELQTLPCCGGVICGACVRRTADTARKLFACVYCKSTTDAFFEFAEGLGAQRSTGKQTWSTALARPQEARSCELGPQCACPRGAYFDATDRVQTRDRDEVLRFLGDDRDAAFFAAPVDPVRDQAPNYAAVIENPMDLSTVAAKLELGAYDGSDDAFAADVHLIFDNAMLYNANPAHIVHEAARRLRNAFDECMNNGSETETPSFAVRNAQRLENLCNLLNIKRFDKPVRDVEKTVDNETALALNGPAERQRWAALETKAREKARHVLRQGPDAVAQSTVFARAFLRELKAEGNQASPRATAADATPEEAATPDERTCQVSGDGTVVFSAPPPRRSAPTAAATESSELQAPGRGQTSRMPQLPSLPATISNPGPQRGDAKLRALQSRRREYEERRLAESAALEPPSAEKRPHPYDFDEPAESTPPPLHKKPRSAALGEEPAAPHGEKRPRDEDDPAEIDRDAKKQHGQSTPASVAHVGQVSAIPGSFWI